MKPLNVSDNPNDDEETLSFLPHEPPIQITVTKNKSKNEKTTKNEKGNRTTKRRRRRNAKISRKNYRLTKKLKEKGFCLPWMIEAILFMMIITSIVIIKALYREKGYDEQQQSYNANVQEWFDLNLEDIPYWCLDHEVTDCQCANPLAPTPRYGHATWTKAYHQNVRAARGAKSKTKQRPLQELDVVFLGDSIMEGFKGTKFGKEVAHKRDNLPVFENLFDTDKGGEFDGMILAIAGDKSPNLLWRIQNGEFPLTLKTKVFWILIGTNDFLKDDLDYCSTDVILMGIKRVIGEVHLQKPGSTIVVNGLLPRAKKDNEGRLYNSEGDEMTIMDAIDNTNEQLKEYCDLHEYLHYFDAKDIFVDTNEELGNDKTSKFIPGSLMADYLHPTALGYQTWGRKIVDELRLLIGGELIAS